MKKCATCGELKDESEYYWRNKLLGKRWGTGNACQKKQRHNWYEKIRKPTRKIRSIEKSTRYMMPEVLFGII